MLATIGSVLSVPPSGFAVIWPATAFLIAVLLLTPARLWWIYPLAVVPAHFVLVAIFDPAPFTVALTQVGGNFALAISTALAVRAADGKPPDFADVRTQLRFVALAGLAVPAVVNALILLVHLANGTTNDFWLSWRQWMVAGIFPTVTIPPVVILAVQHVAARRWNWAYLIELGFLSATMFVATLLTFGGHGTHAWGPVLRLSPLPLMMWAAVRLGGGGSGVVAIAMGSAVIADAIRLEGPFASGAPVEDIIAMQTYLTGVSILVMLLAALLEERRRTEELLRRSEARMALVAASAEIGLWQWDERSRTLWLTDHCRAMLGLPAGAEITPDVVIQSLHPEDRARVTRVLRAGLSSAETAPREFRVVRPGGEERWFSLNTRTQFDKDNKPVLVSGIFQDVTRRIGAEDAAEDLTRRLLALQDEERRSIARELNDHTAQHLVAADLNISLLKRASVNTEELQRLAQGVSSSIHDALNEIRNFTFLLQPPEMDNEELSGVLRRYLEGFRRRTGIETRLRISAAADGMPADQRRTVLRVVQESLATVHRQGGATVVSVNVRSLGGRLHLVVTDDGKGAQRLFEPEAGEHVLGIPVPGAAARIRQLGGQIEVSSRRSRTIVHVAVPLAQPVED